MEKIELKHIVGYLPYGLKVKTNNLVRELSVDVDENYKDIITLNNLITGIGHKPILRPLSDITKDIEFITEDFNNKTSLYPEKISLIDYLNIAKTNVHKYRPRLNRFEYALGNGTVSYNFDVNGQLSMPYDVVRLFFINHFDIFGLIKKGLAISIHDVG